MLKCYGSSTLLIADGGWVVALVNMLVLYKQKSVLQIKTITIPSDSLEVR